VDADHRDRCWKGGRKGRRIILKQQRLFITLRKFSRIGGRPHSVVILTATCEMTTYSGADPNFLCLEKDAQVRGDERPLLLKVGRGQLVYSFVRSSAWLRLGETVGEVTGGVSEISKLGSASEPRVRWRRLPRSLTCSVCSTESR